MLIRAYGVFWHRDWVDWNPGQGGSYRLLGRVGSNRPGLKIADFRLQLGIYVLHGNYGAYYVGLTEDHNRGFGGRLHDHTTDKHKDSWDKFSWFGFMGVSEKFKTDEGLNALQEVNESIGMSLGSAIRDVEALLIQILGTTNRNQTRFKDAEGWEQVSRYDADDYLNKLGSS